MIDGKNVTIVNSLMFYWQDWSWQWFGAIGNIAWFNIDPDLVWRITSLGHN